MLQIAKADHEQLAQTGFTLIEVVFAVIILGTLAVVGTSMLYSGFVTSNYMNSENAAAASGRYALERISREMRQSEKGSVELGSNQISYSRKDDADPNTPLITTIIRYDSTAKRITMAALATGPQYILAENVVSFDCMYQITVLPVTPAPKCSGILATPPLATALTKITLEVEIQENPEGPKLPMNKIVILRNNL